MTPALDLVIAPATPADISAIDEIEQHSFKSPWSRQTFEGELLREWARLDIARHSGRGSLASLGPVAREPRSNPNPNPPNAGGRIIAFCNYWLVTTELHILAIAAHPDFRGRGVGAQMLGHVLDVACRTGCSLATLEVRRSNKPAIAMYERAGFKTVHVRARYYQDDDEDALVMLRGLTPQPP